MQTEKVKKKTKNQEISNGPTVLPEIQESEVSSKRLPTEAPVLSVIRGKNKQILTCKRMKRDYSTTYHVCKTNSDGSRPHFNNSNFTHVVRGARRDGSVVRSTSCSSKGPSFNSQHPHGSSHLPVTPDPKDLTPSQGSVCMCM